MNGMYESPSLEVIEVVVEAGFGGSIWVEDGTIDGSGNVITPPVL